MRTDILALVVGWTLILLCAPLAVVGLATPFLGDGQEFAVRAFLPPVLVSGVLGFLLKRWGTRDDSNERLRDREAFAAVALGWPVVVAIGALPFWLGGMFNGPNEFLAGNVDLSTAAVGYIHSWFESMSGFTTTGATVIDPSTSPICTAAVTDCIAAQPRGLLLWRSLTQWLGGMGIIMLGILIISRFLGGGMSVARAELTGPSLSRLRPRLAQTAKVLWTIYIALTFAEMALLRYVGKLSLFDSVNHALTTMPSGGYSTYDAGIMHFD